MIYEKHLEAVTEMDWGTRKEREKYSIAEVRSQFQRDVNRILIEEAIALEFVDGQFRRIGQGHTQAVVSRAVRTMADPDLEEARKHYAKAISFYSRVGEPDYDNAVKEAAQALEAAVKKLFPKKSTKDFDKLLASIQGTGVGEVPPSIANALRSVHAFRGAAKGVSHGGATGGVVDQHIAELIISWVGASVIYLAATKPGPDSATPF